VTLSDSTPSHQEIFEHYIYAGAITRNPDAVAALFTEDGVYEAPLVADGDPRQRRLAGREAIRAGIGAYQTGSERADVERTTFVLHETADPDVFITEIDAVLTDAGTMSLVQIFRVKDGQIVSLRDYFA